MASVAAESGEASLAVLLPRSEVESGMQGTSGETGRGCNLLVAGDEEAEVELLELSRDPKPELPVEVEDMPTG